MDDGYKGWAQLASLSPNNEDVLVPFSFPLSFEKRYVVGNSKDETVSLMTPGVENPNEEKLPIEAVLAVKANGKVFLERPAGRNTDVWVNGEKIEAGCAWRTPLENGSTITFGPWQYLLTKRKGKGVNRTVDKMSIDRCQVCGERSPDGVRIMVCGHNICPRCCRTLTAQPAGVYRNQEGQWVVLQDGYHRIERWIPPHPAQAQLNPGPAAVDRAVPLFCTACRNRISMGVGRSAITSITVTQITKTMLDAEAIDEHRPMCDGCRNQRGLFGSRDYDFCERCQQMLCAPCVLQSHRDHELRQRVDRLRELDEVSVKIDSIKKSLAEMERKQEEFSSDQRLSEGVKSVRDHFNNVKASLKRNINTFRQHLTNIQNRKRALARRWDETSRDMAEMIDQLVQESRQLHDYLDRLRNGEVSVSLNSSSSEDESPSSSSSPTSTSSSTT